MDLASAKHLAFLVLCLHLVQHVLHAIEPFYAKMLAANGLQQDISSTATTTWLQAD